MKPFYLIVFPLVFLVATGFVYSNWLMWYNSGGGAGNPVGGLATGDPLFDLMNGDYSAMFSSLKEVLFGTANFELPIPFTVTAATHYYGGFKLTDAPWIKVYWTPITIPLFGGFTFNIPAIMQTSVPINIPSIPIPIPNIEWWVDTYPIPLSGALLSMIAGVVMILLGLGIGVRTALAGFSTSSQGAKLLQVIGIGILLWAFVSLFTANWLLTSANSSWGNILYGFLELCFILGIYWQSQSQE